MSTCPKDLHSVYIDGEMPENFLGEYEKLVSLDEKAKSEQEKMLALHNVFKEDSEAKTADKIFADQSFERLQQKMHYSKVVHETQGTFVIPFAKYTASFAAAVAVFALIFTPIHIKAVKSLSNQEINAINITTKIEAPDLAKSDVVVDGNIETEKLSKTILSLASSEGIAKVESLSSAADNSSYVAKADESTSEDGSTTSETAAGIEQKTVRASYLASNGGFSANSEYDYNTRFRERLPSVDVFQPDFSSSASSIRISVPKFHKMGNNLESVPNLSDYAGN